MGGQLGYESSTVKHLLVYKIDYKNSLLYVKGSVAGVADSLLEIFDSKWKHDVQFKTLPHPTFVEDPKKEYQDVMVFTGTQDLNEVYNHDNDEVLGVSEEEQEGEPEQEEEGQEGAAAGGAEKK
jgi:hypothetical protein